MKHPKIARKASVTKTASDGAKTEPPALSQYLQTRVRERQLKQLDGLAGWKPSPEVVATIAGQIVASVYPKYERQIAECKDTTDAVFSTESLAQVAVKVANKIINAVRKCNLDLEPDIKTLGASEALKVALEANDYNLSSELLDDQMRKSYEKDAANFREEVWPLLCKKQRKRNKLKTGTSVEAVNFEAYLSYLLPDDPPKDRLRHWEDYHAQHQDNPSRLLNKNGILEQARGALTFESLFGIHMKLNLSQFTRWRKDRGIRGRKAGASKGGKARHAQALKPSNPKKKIRASQSRRKAG